MTILIIILEEFIILIKIFRKLQAIITIEIHYLDYSIINHMPYYLDYTFIIVIKNLDFRLCLINSDIIIMSFIVTFITRFTFIMLIINLKTIIIRCQITFTSKEAVKIITKIIKINYY